MPRPTCSVRRARSRQRRYEYRGAGADGGWRFGQTLERKRAPHGRGGHRGRQSARVPDPAGALDGATGKRAGGRNHTSTSRNTLADRDLPPCHASSASRCRLLCSRDATLSEPAPWQQFLATSDVVRNGARHRVDPVQVKNARLGSPRPRAATAPEIYLAGDRGATLATGRVRRDRLLGPRRQLPMRAAYTGGARRSAADAAIVSTNHALLLAETNVQGQVLGPYEALVIDEAPPPRVGGHRTARIAVRLADVTLILDRLPALP